MIWMLVINVSAFTTYGIDKYKAEHEKWRISEDALIGLAGAGGAIGAWIGMYVFHHKTKHLKFRILVPVFSVIWIVVSGIVLSHV